MLTFNIGPFPVAASQLTFFLAGLVSLGVGRLVANRQQRTQAINGIAFRAIAESAEKPEKPEKPEKLRISNTLWDMFLFGLVAARLAFVLTWLSTYRDNPWSMLDVRDGGFTPWAGVTAALLVALWQGARQVEIRKPLILGLFAGALTWGVLQGAMRLTTDADPGLPTVVLTTLSGESADLATLADGKPLVVNLWASWCPPCRREMPVLAAAQQRESGVRFVFANQGEDAVAVLRYLSGNRLNLSHVVFDPAAALGTAVGSKALPTTLFYDAAGRLVDTHLGALSAASLSSKLKSLHEASPR